MRTLTSVPFKKFKNPSFCRSTASLSISQMILHGLETSIVWNTHFLIPNRVKFLCSSLRTCSVKWSVMFGKTNFNLKWGVFVNSVSKVWFSFFFHKLMQGNLKEEYGSLSKGFFSGMTTLTAQQTWCYWWRYKVNQQWEWAQALKKDVMGECPLAIMPASNPFDSPAE